MTDSQDEIREFTKDWILLKAPEIVSAAESLKKAIEDFTDAMNRLAEKL